MRVVRHSRNQLEVRHPPDCVDDLTEALTVLELSDAMTPQLIRSHIGGVLASQGWSKEMRISPDSKISITAYRDQIGLCLQTGNVSRIYADLLKLQTLFARKSIVAGVCIVPITSLAVILGSNVVSYERLLGELEIFALTITVPITVIGIGR